MGIASDGAFVCPSTFLHTTLFDLVNMGFCLAFFCILFSLSCCLFSYGKNPNYGKQFQISLQIYFSLVLVAVVRLCQLWKINKFFEKSDLNIHSFKSS